MSSSISTESACVPFELHSLQFPVFRSFLDLMPSADLFTLRQHDETVDKLSNFRGEVVKSLYVLTDTKQPWNTLYESYSKIMSRPNLTASDFLQVFMGPDICPETLLSKINEKTYHTLYICGQYHWKQVIPFLHTGIDNCVSLYDNMELPEEDMDEFFKILCSYGINDFSFYNTECDNTWVKAAHKTLSSLIGTVFKSVEVVSNPRWFNSVTAVANDDTVMTLTMDHPDRRNYYY